MTVDNGAPPGDDTESASTPRIDRADRGRFGPGNRLGRGRPKSSVTAAMRRRADPDRLADFLVSTMESTRAPIRERVRCCEILISYLDGKPVSRNVSMTLGAASLLPDHFATMSLSERERALDDLRHRAVSGELALTGGDDHDDTDDTDDTETDHG